eukprot:CAMPEP_0172479928 /NCGR_PEP_ID=MMETSP1066-20121228/4748_1 /TAXON_ID=671091 /ORGANISM="Coscinodiscus wailesii, Strain CCMP2513" /LENGTH=44 /DNA_ID= /DNA_START= /DNA_END= /DNA_ORIENTATION=
MKWIPAAGDNNNANDNVPRMTRHPAPYLAAALGNNEDYPMEAAP